MKRLTPFLLGTLCGVLVLAAFTIGQVSAAPLAAIGCFPDTNGHWAESFICWAAQKGIVGGYPDGTFKPENNVTRAQAVIMLKNQAEIPPTTGEHYFNAGPNAWQPNSGGATGQYVDYYTIQSLLRSSATGVRFFQVTPSLPSTLYSKTTYFKGVLLCYRTEGAAFIDSVDILHEKFMGVDGTTVTLAQLTDPTNRTGYGCRRYEITEPSTYYPDNILSLLVKVNFSNTTTDYVRIYSTVFILGASDLEPGYLYSMEMPDLMMQEPDPQALPAQGPETGQ